MPRADIIIYQEKNGEVPLLAWLDSKPSKVQDKCISKIGMLNEYGFDLRRPHCDILSDGIYELRAKHMNVHYRILYSFVGKSVVLLSHGCTKKDKVPKADITRALRNYKNYTENPEAHTYVGEI